MQDGMVMCTSFLPRLIPLYLGVALTACGSDLTLPESGPPPDDRSPAQLLAISGNGQEARVGRRVDNPLRVRVMDASDRPVVGAPVEFRFEEAAPDAEVDPATTETDEDGYASASVRLGNAAGLHKVEARVPDATLTNLRTTFDLTAVERSNRGGGGDNDDDDDDD
jgi:hypothetical protein